MEQYLPMSKLKQLQTTSPTLGKAQFLAFSSQLIDEALNEALQDIEILSNTLFDIASTTKKLGDVDATEIGRDIKNLSQKALGQLQFADRMQQRLNNIGSNLENMAKHSAGNDESDNEKIWHEFLSEARKEFTMESEKILFDRFFGEIKSDKKRPPNTNKKDDVSNTHLF